MSPLKLIWESLSALNGVDESWSPEKFSEWVIVPPPKLTTPPFVATNAPDLPLLIVLPVPFKLASAFAPDAIAPIP